MQTTGERVVEAFVSVEEGWFIDDPLYHVKIGERYADESTDKASAELVATKLREEIAKAIDKAIFDHIAAVQPVGPEDAIVLEIQNDLQEYEDGNPGAWNKLVGSQLPTLDHIHKLVAAFDHQRAIIARLINDSDSYAIGREQGCKEGRKEGQCEEREACVQVAIEFTVRGSLQRSGEAHVTAYQIAEVIRQRGTKETSS